MSKIIFHGPIEIDEKTKVKEVLEQLGIMNKA